RHYSHTTELFQAFSGRMPRLVFLSGCRTAQADGNMASMAMMLVQQGIPAVLGWGRPVLDRSATVAAAQLYQRLAEGFSIVEALSATYAYLREQHVPDWHLLRLHVGAEAWGAMVEPPGDYVPPIETVQDQFLDAVGAVRVAGPEQFVGRRRLLQACLKYLKRQMGVLLHGLGGNGKSTLATRLLERLSDYTPLVIYRHVDDTELTSKLSQQCESEQGLAILNSELPLRQRLSKFLRQGLNSVSQRFCFVLDDFEANLEADVNGKQVLKADVVAVINDLFNAIVQSGQPHRVILTSRYDVVFPEQNQRIERAFVPALKGADLTKKYNRLSSFQRQSFVDVDLQQRAKTVADGNPRLLEWLDIVLQDAGTDQAQILDRMEAEETRFRENILAEELLRQQSDTLKEMLARALVFELAVPEAAMMAIWDDLSDWGQHCQRAVALGLLELSQPQGEISYRVPRILEILLPSLEESNLVPTAANELYELWWKRGRDQLTEEKCLELYRLATVAEHYEQA
ncbi:MAG: CHAT domain-containing protein, partial [Cyanobacteria bacterium P01_F01_bin.3]